MSISNDVCYYGYGRTLFQLQESDVDVQVSHRCSTGLTHTSLHPKTRISVMWQAPPNNEGCINFQAMVLEYRDIWYMDEGPLTKHFCQISKGWTGRQYCSVLF